MFSYRFFFVLNPLVFDSLFNGYLPFQNQQFELDVLLERVTEICKRADKNNKQQIQKESAEVSNEWYNLISDLENRRDTLSKLAQVWETFEGRYQHFESLLTGLEEKSKHVDLVVRNRQHVINTKQNIEVIKADYRGKKSFWKLFWCLSRLAGPAIGSRVIGAVPRRGESIVRHRSALPEGVFRHVGRSSDGKIKAAIGKL